MVYIGSFETKLQERLAHPQTWREVCDVTFTDTRVITSSNITVAPTVNTVTRDTVTNIAAITVAAQTLTISTGSSVSTQIDFADVAQVGYNLLMEHAEEAADLLNEAIETAVLARHTNWRDIGSSGGVITDNVAGAITLDASNIDDLARMIRRVVRAQNGGRLIKSNGLFCVVSPTELDLVEAFAMANGFSEADLALKNGLDDGVKYMGIEWYVSNDTTSGHLFAGVKKRERVGVLRSEYGKVRQQDFPAGASGGFYEGILLYTRADYGHLTPTKSANILLDINRA